MLKNLKVKVKIGFLHVLLRTLLAKVNLSENTKQIKKSKLFKKKIFKK